MGKINHPDFSFSVDSKQVGMIFQTTSIVFMMIKLLYREVDFLVPQNSLLRLNQEEMR